VPAKKTVRVQADPIDNYNPSSKLAEYFRTNLKEKTRK